MLLALTESPACRNGREVSLHKLWFPSLVPQCCRVPKSMAPKGKGCWITGHPCKCMVRARHQSLATWAASVHTFRRTSPRPPGPPVWLIVEAATEPGVGTICLSLLKDDLSGPWPRLICPQGKFVHSQNTQEAGQAWLGWAHLPAVGLKHRPYLGLCRGVQVLTVWLFRPWDPGFSPTGIASPGNRQF